MVRFSDRDVSSTSDRSRSRRQSGRSPGPDVGISRRQFVAAAGTTTLGASAGCTTVANWIADLALGDVNVFNQTERTINGTIEIDGPSDTTVLLESFELDPSSDNDEDDESETTASYGEVWAEAGDYHVSVVLDDDTEVRGESAATDSVTIENPGEDMLAIPLGADDVAAGIAFRVGDEWSEFHDRE